MQVVECVPNFSEGRNRGVIEEIAASIRSVEGVRLLHIDIGEATNRTVMTFVGSAEAVLEAAFQAVRCASELIDMRHHRGTHPRLGATDVLPLAPISGITLEECAELAHKLASRIAEELLIPIYCYEAAAVRPERRNLAICRHGEYEALALRVIDPLQAPDYGARPYDEIMARSGAINLGARNFLIAVNFNLDSTSAHIASQIAFDIRESGRAVKDQAGKRVTIPGRLKACKAIGWYIEEYGVAQVSMNLTDIEITSLHTAFDEVSDIASTYGVRVTGTEIIGLVPRRVLIQAGRHYLLSRAASVEVSNSEAINAAIDAMHLDDLSPFIVRKKVIEEML